MDSQKDVFVAGHDGYHTYRIPTLVVTKKETILCCCEGRKYGAGDSGDIDLLLKRSSDSGRTWSKQIIVCKKAGDVDITIGNPCPIVGRDENVVHLLFCRNNKAAFYTRSTDDGLIWSEPKELAGILEGFDFPGVRVGTGPVHGIQTGSGRLLFPIWLCDAKVDSLHKTYRSGVIYSDDQGNSFRAGGLVPPTFTGLNECAVFERVDGTLVLNMRGSDHGFRATSISKDAGLQWSKPVIAKDLPCPTCQASILRLSNREVLFSNPAVSRKGGYNAQGRKNMTVRLSYDDGRTWPTFRVLNNGPSGYSDLAVMKDGAILCAYECGEKQYHEKISLARFSREWIRAG